MADDSTTNHPSLPSDYVSINDLRDRWLKKQQQKQPQHQQEEQVRIKTTIRDKGKDKVQEVTTNHPSLPTNYVTILDLQERWLKRQQKEEENDRIETTIRDKGKEIVQEVTVDCYFDGISDKNNPHFRNPNPNLIPERGFCRNTREKARVTVDCQVDGNADKNRLQFRNPNPNLIREREFRRNPNGSNWRPIHRGFQGGEKISTQNQAVKANSSSLKASEISDGVEIEAEIVDDSGQLKDASLTSQEEKTLRDRIWKKERKERRQFAKEKGENEEMIKLNVERRQIAKKEREDEEMRKLNVSKVGEIGEQTREIEAKMKEINVSKSRGIGEKTRETEAKMKQINLLKSRGIGEKTRETEGKMKEINVSKIGRIVEKTREIETKMKGINVSKIGRIVEKTRETEAKMKDINVSKIEEKTRKTEAKMKEMTVTEQCFPGKEKEVLMVTVKAVPKSKSVREVRWGDWRAKTDQKMEVYGRGRRGFNEPRGAKYGEGNRGDKCGLKWVKKGEGAEKVLNNGCVVEDGVDQVN